MLTNHKGTRLPRILLAEDDRAIARLIAIALKRTGIPHELETVHDGHQALDSLKKTTDLLLLDLHMPGKNGFEVLEHVKQDPLLRGIPVVVLSNSDQPADVIKAHHLYANAYVRKSPEFAVLCQTMDSLLRFWLQIAISSV